MHNKSADTNLISNYFVLASSVIAPFLADLFSAVLRHGHMPAAVRDCVLVLIPKPLKDPSNSDRCRPITLAIQISVKPWNVAFSSTTGLLKVI